jgi:rubrerythrin
MSTYFNADEIFQMGIQIETNGQRFYETVANHTSEATIRKLFSELSRWESEHIDLFDKLRQALPDSAKKGDLFDPNQELQLYIKATAESHVFIKNKDITDLASKCKTPSEALDLAITFEKDSVVFYATMKKVVPEDFGKRQIDFLIDEEINHISILVQKGRELKTQRGG